MKMECQIRSGMCEKRVTRAVYQRGKRYNACSECAEAVIAGGRLTVVGDRKEIKAKQQDAA